MKLHASGSSVLVVHRQYWRGSSMVMHLHKNRPIKRAGVAGIALRAEGVNTVIYDRLRASWWC
ncbi:hypothetical protein CJD50_14110 [Hafnia paralvei]|uniref:Uncharacterized protein n=1 Tax=Hafnia paralvei TaxID=546367 RepID=A0A2A2MCD0_9GAMM|nr:hypothetical protein CJD50_14110 [Hafnia paralvei]